MSNRTRLAMLAAALTQAAFPLFAADVPERCTMPVSVEDRVRQRSEDELRQLYVRCALISEQRRLDGQETLACSVASDALLDRGFQGNFDAMLAWSREQLALQRGSADASNRVVRRASELP